MGLFTFFLLPLWAGPAESVIRVLAQKRVEDENFHLQRKMEEEPRREGKHINERLFRRIKF